MIFPVFDDTVENPKPTALFAATASMSAANSWASVNGWSAPKVYTTVEEEFEAATSDAAMVDLGPLCRYTARGPDAAAVCSRMTTAPVEELEIGESARGLILSAVGLVVDIVDVARLSGDLFLVTSSSPHERRMQLAARGFDAVIENITGRVAALAIIGPKARDAASAAGVDSASEHLAAQGRVRGVETAARPVHIGAYPGVEIIYPFEEALTLWERVRRAYDLIPAGLDALEVLRIEGGSPKPGLDFVSADRRDRASAYRSPDMLGMPHLAPVRRAWFNGRRAMTEQADARNRAARKQARVIVVLSVDAEIAATGAAVMANGKPVGRVTSWAYSPRLKRVVAFVDIAHAAQSLPLAISAAPDIADATADGEMQHIPAKVLETPESLLAAAARAAVTV